MKVKASFQSIIPEAFNKKCSDVLVAKSRYSTVYFDLKKAVELLDCLYLENDDTVVIKINLCDARVPDTGVITHPLFLNALLKLLRDTYGFGLEIKVVESDATVALPDLFIKWFGFMDVLKKWNAKYVNLSKDKIVYKKSTGKIFEVVPVPETIDCADYFITLPKLKTNSLTKITCCLKNQFGCLPIRNKKKFHNFIDSVLAELNSVMKPNLCIVDGIISHIGVQGPVFGQPFPSNLIILGEDPVAVDTVASKILGFNPRYVGHLRESEKMKVGSMNFNLIGEEKITPIYRPNFIEWHLHKFGSYLQTKSKNRV